MVTFEFGGTLKRLCRTGVYGEAFDRLVELHDEPVAEVLGNAAAVACGIAYDSILLRNDLDE